MRDHGVPDRSPNPQLEALHRLEILDSDYEAPFDRIVRMVADHFGISNVGIHLLDDERQWVKAFEGQRFACAREDSVCQFTVEHDDLLIIPDLRADTRTQGLGIVTGPPWLRFYAGMPLRTREGYVVGTLCLIDTQVRPPLEADERRWLKEFANLVIETMELRVEYHRSQQQLHTAVEFDAVTGLRNRTGTVREGQRRLDETPTPAAVAAIKVRLDRMNLVSRATGRTGGTQVVEAAAARLRALVGPDDLLGRGDGDSFIILRICHLQNDEQQLDRWLDETANGVLERLGLGEPFTVDNEEVIVTGSVGLALFTDRSPVNHVIDAASAASLGSQEAGGNQAQRFSPDAFADFRERVSVESDLRAAVADRAFTLNYQPIVDISAGARVVGAEALLRWPRGDKHPVGPDRFIPVAEEMGLIHELGLWVFEAACRDFAALCRQGTCIWISVNLSPLQLSDRALGEKLAQRARDAGVPSSRIKLEITESALATHFNDVVHTLEQLRDAGFLLALDDFGTGHSSLARLIRMPFDTIKVDRGFVNDCPDGRGAAVVTSVGSLARHLNMNLVAEGVEHDGHERFLRDTGYTLAQGYYYARPMTAAALSDHLAIPA